MALTRPQLSGMKQSLMSCNSPSSLSGHTLQGPHPFGMLGGVEPDGVPPTPNVLHCMSDMLPTPRAPGASTANAMNHVGVITTSIDEGVEADMMDRDSESTDALTAAGRFAALQRDPYGVGLLPQYGNVDGSFGAGLYKHGLSGATSSSLSLFSSFDSSLEVDVAPSSPNASTVLPPTQHGGPQATNSMSRMQPVTSFFHGNTLPFLQVVGNVSPAVCSTVSSSTPISLVSKSPVTCMTNTSEGDAGGDNPQHGEEILQDRGQTRSPVNFREGRRASDGLVAQGIIAFRQRLRECMRAHGMAELRQEHQQLQSLFSAENSNNGTTVGGANIPPISSTQHHALVHPHPHPHRKLSAPHHSIRQWSLDEPGSAGGMATSGGTAMGRRRPLMKRMSLPSESFDIQPHRLLALKQSMHLEQQLDRAVSQEEEGPLVLPSSLPPPIAAPQAPPLPCSSHSHTYTSPHYEFATCGKSLQQQLSHHLQQRRQVFQKLRSTHQHAPHPHQAHTHPLDITLAPPLQLSTQLQQLQIDPNNLPRIDFSMSYPPVAHSHVSGESGTSLSSQSPNLCSYPNAVPCGVYTPTHQIISGYSSTFVSQTATLQGLNVDPSPCNSSASTADLGFCPSLSEANSASNAVDDFLEQLADCQSSKGQIGKHNNATLVENPCKRGDAHAASKDHQSSTIVTTQWQRRQGISMAVHPFQDAAMFSASISDPETTTVSDSPSFLNAGVSSVPPLDSVRGSQLGSSNSYRIQGFLSSFPPLSEPSYTQLDNASLFGKPLTEFQSHLQDNSANGCPDSHQVETSNYSKPSLLKNNCANGNFGCGEILEEHMDVS